MDLPTRIRVPDIVVTDDALPEPFRRTAPLLCVEILAPEDYLHTLFPRLIDIEAMGTPHIWLLDPIHRLAFTFNSASLQLATSSTLSIPETPISLKLPALFADAFD